MAAHHEEIHLDGLLDCTPRVTTLNFGYTVQTYDRWSDDQVPEFGRVAVTIGKLTNLQTLQLMCKIHSSKFTKLADVLCSIPHLVELDLRSTWMFVRGGTYRCTATPHWAYQAEDL